MTEESASTPSLEERLQAIREGVKLVAQAARPGLAESLKIAHDALRTIDSAVVGQLRTVSGRPALAGLYVIVDPEHCGGRDPLKVAEEALEGGASIIQWRDKRRDKGDQLPVVRSLQSLCERHAAILIVNDHVDLALASGAGGVHVGQHDLPVAAVRRLVPASFVVGCSTNNPDEARQAQQDGADYVAVGRVFASTTKPDTRDASPATVREVKQAVSIPVVAIGGITSENVEETIEAGADAAAVITAVCAAADVETAARAISKRFELAEEKRRQAASETSA